MVRVEGLEPPRLTDLFFHFASNLRQFLDVSVTQLYLPVNPRYVPFEAKCVPNVSTTDNSAMLLFLESTTGWQSTKINKMNG